MLDPSDRQVFFDLLKPPDAYVFGEAIATTYSLDLDTLLQAAVSLEMPHLDSASAPALHGLAVLQSVRRVAPRLTVFCDAVGMDPPGAGVLYGLLEPVLAQAQAPHGGSLHAKLWLIRFDPALGEEVESFLRLIVLSRNLTQDRCWDVSVALDGEIRAKRKFNNPLVALLEKLPSCALQPLRDDARVRLVRLAEQVGRADWDLPEGFEELTFHVLGIGPRPKTWMPLESDRLVVISPFVSAPALEGLLESSSEPPVLIARSEELDRCEPAVLQRFGAVHVVSDMAALEDGEDSFNPDKPHELRGLHAKTYVAKSGKNTHLYLGSANATATALTSGLSIEVMVELSGRTSAVPGKGIDGLLASSGFGSLLMPYTPAPDRVVDARQEEAEEALRVAARALASAGLTLRFDPVDGEFMPVLMTRTSFTLPGISKLSAWLISSDISNARSIEPLLAGQAVQLATCEAAAATALVGFQLQATAKEVSREFVLCLPAMSMPAQRDTHISRKVIGNEARLLQYLRGLLQGSDVLVYRATEVGSGPGPNGSSRTSAGGGLLEELIRAKARDPERFGDALAAMRDLGSDQISPELLAIWSAFAPESAP